MRDNRWITSTLVDLHEFAEGEGLDDVARALAEAIEVVSPALGGALPRRDGRLAAALPAATAACGEVVLFALEGRRSQARSA